MFKHWMVVVGALAGLAACGSPSAGDQLILTGSSTIAPLAMSLGKRFEAEHPGTRVDVQMGGSSRGVADARSGVADIGMVSRPLKDGEHDLHAIAIARDGVCIIVHRDNPLVALSDAQIVAIYTGEIDDWFDLGGPAGPILVVNKAEGHSTLELFLHHFSLKNSQIKADAVIGDNEQGIQTVAGSPLAIGYVSIGSAEYDAEHGVAIRLLPVGGVRPSSDSVRDGSYPLARPLNLVTKAAPTGLSASFIDFARSAQAAPLVEAQYFVPVAR